MSKSDGTFFPQNTRCCQDMDKVAMTAVVSGGVDALSFEVK